MGLKEAKDAVDKIETSADLQKNGITHSDYLCLLNVMRDLERHKSGKFIQDGVKRFLENHGIEVNQHGIGYCATVK